MLKDRIIFEIDKGTKREFAAACAKQGKSKASVLRKLIQSYINRSAKG